jgi:hypothetical protein
MVFLWLVLLQLALFGALVFFLRVIFTKNVSTATEHLHTLNQDYTQKLEEARKHQADADKYYDETLLKAKVDAEKTKMQILKETQATQEATVNESRKQSADILEQANRARESMLKEVESRIEAGAVEKAGELMQAVLPEVVGEALHGHWVRELLVGGLEDLGRLNVPETLDEALVISAYPLKKDEKAALEKKLCEKLKHVVRVTETTDPALLAGFRIALGNVLIDGSLRFQIKEAVRHAQQPV